MPFETSKQKQTQQHGQAVKYQLSHWRGLSPAGSGGQNEQPNDAPDARGKGEEMSDLIDREAALNCFHCWADKYGDVHTPDEMPEYRAIEDLPSAPDKEKISDAFYQIYRNIGTNTSAEGVVAIKYYIAEIWRELFGEEAPIWLKK